MMKIYMYIAHMGAGGSERVCVNLANEFIRMGHEVYIITLNMEKHAYEHVLSKECHIHSLGVSRIRYSMFPLWRLLRKEKPEKIMVFSHELLVWLMYLKKLHLVKAKIILRNQNNLEFSYTEKTEVSPMVQKILKANCKIVNQCDGIIAQCEAMKQHLIDSLSVDGKKITTIYNPVSRELGEQVIRVKKSTEEQKQVVMIGRLEPQKNVEHMLHAFEQISKHNKNIRLRIVGDGYQRKELEELRDSLGLKELVVFEGIRKDIQNVYAEADVIALSSSYEGMPNTLIEGISLGIPVVSYDCPSGPAEIIQDGVNGYLVPYMDVNALAERIDRAVTHLWDETAIKKTADQFNVETVAKQYITMIGNI